MRRGGSLAVGAGEGNRTLVSCLGSNSSTIELRPHSERFSTAFSVFNGHLQGWSAPQATFDLLAAVADLLHRFLYGRCRLACLLRFVTNFVVLAACNTRPILFPSSTRLLRHLCLRCLVAQRLVCSEVPECGRYPPRTRISRGNGKQMRRLLTLQPAPDFCRL
jgi:hypothetical protein